MLNKPKPKRHRKTILRIAMAVFAAAAISTFLVIDPRPPRAQAQEPSSATVTKIVSLSHSDANNVLEVLQNLSGNQDLRTAVDRITNSIILRGSESAVQEAMALIEQLDEAAQHAHESNADGTGRVNQLGIARGGRGFGGVGRQGGFEGGRGDAAGNFFYGFSGGIGGAPGAPSLNAQQPPVPVPGGVGGFPSSGNSFGVEGQPNVFFPPYASSSEAQQIAQELAALEQQTMSLAQVYRSKRDSLESAEREKMSTEIRRLVEQAFDKRHQLQSLEAKQLQERLAKVQNALARREELKSKIVDKRLDDLLSNDELNWNTQQPPYAGTPYGYSTGGLWPVPANVPATSPPNVAPRSAGQPPGETPSPTPTP